MCTLAAASVSGNAQTLMTIQVSNYLAYDDDVADPATFATSPGIVPGTGRVFQRLVLIGDITAVNGQRERAPKELRGAGSRRRWHITGERADLLLWPVVFPDVTRSSLWHTRYFHNGSACVTRS